MDNPEKLATRRRKRQHNVLDTTTCMCKQTQKNVRLTWALLQTTESNAHIYIYDIIRIK
jgi:hypothetical protein